jgi:probable F420-dependent oxidoreductase
VLSPQRAFSPAADHKSWKGVAQQRAALSAEPAHRIVSFDAKPLLLDDFLLTRMMEIVVHAETWRRYHDATVLPTLVAMKIRIGVGLGTQTQPAQLSRIVDRLEAAGVDSVWLSEQVYSDAVEPFIGMAHVLSRTTRLKAGTSVAVLPGRHPVLVAKQLASLAALAPKRVLPVFGLRPARRPERDLFVVPTGRRADVFDESLRLLRAALTSDTVDFTGEFHRIDGVRIGPRPQPPLDVWLGGAAPAALRRIGRYGDGWLGSFMPAGDARRAREAIEAAAAEAGREIEPDHYGLSVSLADGGISPELAAIARDRRPGADPSEVIAGSWPDLHRLLDGYVAAGLTKFVIHHRGPQPFDEFLDRFITELVPRQT